MKKIYLIGFILLLCCSCSEKKKYGKKTISKISVKNAHYNDVSDYSSIIDSIEVIQLETKKQSIIGGIRKIEFNSNKIYIADRNNNLLIFDSNGNYKNKLDKIGRGPGEYYELRDFFIEDNGFIKILSWKKIITYDSNLKFAYEEKLDITNQTNRKLNPVLFFPLKGYTFLFTGSFGLDKIIPQKDNALFCINDEHEIINEFLPLLSDITHGHQVFYKSNNTVNLTYTYGNDTIYTINKDIILPKYVIDFNDKKITKKDMVGNRKLLFERIWQNNLSGNIQHIYENYQYLCFKFTNGKRPKQGVYNKNTKEIKIINITKTIPFPGIIVLGVTDDNFFFSVLEPSLIIRLNNNGLYDYFFNSNNLSELKLIDNPIIVKYKFAF